MGGIKVVDGLEMTVVRSRSGIYVAVHGEIDELTVEQLERTLLGAVLEEPVAVNVDLLDVGFLGSVGINTLVRVRQQAAAKGITFRIVKASRRVEMVLDLMGLAGQFMST